MIMAFVVFVFFTTIFLITSFMAAAHTDVQDVNVNGNGNGNVAAPHLGQQALRGRVSGVSGSGDIDADAHNTHNAHAHGLKASPTAISTFIATQPPIMYGTAWKKERTKTLVETAIRNGFRGVDTANQPKHYTESGVGEALQALYAGMSYVF
jgi:hypothetical protein